MIDIKTIVVPVDFSDVAPLIAKWAKETAKKFNAQIILVHVIEDISALEGFSPSTKTLQELEKTLMEGAQEYMQNFLSKYFSDFNQVKPIITKGKIVEKIIEIAEKNSADLIVIGTHGRKGLDKIIFGSVAEGVVKYSPIPVLTINPYRIKEK